MDRPVERQVERRGSRSAAALEDVDAERLARGLEQKAQCAR
jgi:hypothetical protein